jgi:hypothetical protein
VTVGISRYEKSESKRFTFVGRAESDEAADLIEKVENCLIGLNLEPDSGWAWIPEGSAVAGDLVELLTDRFAEVLARSADLDDQLKRRLASQLADSIAAVVPRFDRDRFLGLVESA